MTQKFFLIITALMLSSAALFADIADQVVIVRAEFPEHVQDTYERIANWMENSGDSELGNYFRGIKSGRFGSGSIIKSPEGRILILTNYHVVSHSPKVSVEFGGRRGEGKKYESLQVIATDIDRDLALIELKAPAEELPATLDFAEGIQPDGTKVWSAGFPGLISSPSWQFAEGTVTNQEASVKELRVPEISYVIQHSALIAPGSSGGPLLVPGRTKGTYLIAGVNTWRIRGRDNTYFAIPASEAKKYVDEFGDWSEETDSQVIQQQLQANCENFIKVFASSEEDINSAKAFISDSLISEIGWTSYLTYRKELDDDKRKSLDAILLNRDPYDAMSEAVAIQISSMAGDSGGELLSVEKSEDGQTASARYRFGEQEIDIKWIRNKDSWQILGSEKIDQNIKEKKEKAPGKGIDRRVEDFSVIIGGGLVIPTAIKNPYSLTVEKTPGFRATLGIETLFNPFFGLGSGFVFTRYKIRIHDSSIGYQYKYTNIGGYGNLRVQVPLVAGKKLTLIPYVSAGLCAGLNLEYITGFGPGSSSTNMFFVEFPVNLGLEMTTSKLVNQFRWGLGASMIFFPPPSGGFYGNVKMSMITVDAFIRFAM